MPSVPPAIHTAPSASPAAPGAVHAPPANTQAAASASEIVTTDVSQFGLSTDAQEIVIGGRTYYFGAASAGEAAGGIFAGADSNTFARNFVHAINGTWPDPAPPVDPYDPALTPIHTQVSAEFIGLLGLSATFRITAAVPGAAGNSIATTSACPALVFASATLLGGDDGIPAPTVYTPPSTPSPAAPPAITS